MVFFFFFLIYIWYGFVFVIITLEIWFFSHFKYGFFMGQFCWKLNLHLPSFFIFVKNVNLLEIEESLVWVTW